MENDPVRHDEDALPDSFIKDTLTGLAEANGGQTKAYTPGDFMTDGRGEQGIIYTSWKEFFELADGTEIPADFLADCKDRAAEERE